MQPILPSFLLYVNLCTLHRCAKLSRELSVVAGTPLLERDLDTIVSLGVNKIIVATRSEY